MDPVMEDNLVQQIEDVNNNFEEKPIKEAKYFCKSTEWRPTKLQKLEDFFYDLDKTKPDHLEYWKTRGECSEEITSIDEMTEPQRIKFDEFVRNYKN